MQPVGRKEAPTLAVVVAVSEELQWQRVGRLRGRRENCATAMEKGKANTGRAKRAEEEQNKRRSAILFVCLATTILVQSISSTTARDLQRVVVLSRLMSCSPRNPRRDRVLER